jgi:hypothetical protein
MLLDLKGMEVVKGHLRILEMKRRKKMRCC